MVSDCNYIAICTCIYDMMSEYKWLSICIWLYGYFAITLELIPLSHTDIFIYSMDKSFHLCVSLFTHLDSWIMMRNLCHCLLSLHSLVCTCNIYLLHQTTWWPEEWELHKTRHLLFYSTISYFPKIKVSSCVTNRGSKKISEKRNHLSVWKIDKTQII